LEALDAGPVDEKDCRAALVHFGPLWDSLRTREQARISRTLVARVAYDGTSAIPYNLQNRGISFSRETPRDKRDVLASGGGIPANALNYGLRSGYPPPHRLRTDAGAHIVAYAPACGFQKTVIPCTRTAGLEVTGKTVGANGSESRPLASIFRV